MSSILVSNYFIIILWHPNPIMSVHSPRLVVKGPCVSRPGSSSSCGQPRGTLLSSSEMMQPTLHHSGPLCYISHGKLMTACCLQALHRGSFATQQQVTTACARPQCRRSMWMPLLLYRVHLLQGPCTFWLTSGVDCRGPLVTSHAPHIPRVSRCLCPPLSLC